MEIVVDLETGVVALAGPGDMKGFAVRVGEPSGASGAVTGDRDRLAGILTSVGVGRIGGTGDAFVRPDAVRDLAAGQVGEDWAEGFAGMCAYA
ncbi:MAG TPA: hypothetical protein VHW47_03540, partial [Acidimicrobiales bacterium]|nr:hypothetical protein [Acidimicrobiales bacterium]